MLDHCSISHKGMNCGVVLWSRSFTPEAAHLASSPASPVNSLIREALIEGRTTDDKYERDGYAVKWTFVNDLELIFVVAYQRILQLTYVDELLLALKALFVKYFEPVIAAFVASLHALNSAKSATLESTSWNFAKIFDKWDGIFDDLLRSLEDKDRRSRGRPTIRSAPKSIETPPSDDQSTEPSVDVDAPRDEQQITRNLEALKSRLRGRGGRRGGRGGRQGMIESWGGRESPSNSDSETPTKRKAKAKTKRTWGDSQPTETDMDALDYSVDKPADGDAGNTDDLQALVDQSSLGSRNRDGMYEVKDWEFTNSNDILANVIKPLDKNSSSSMGTLGSLFARLTGSKVLTEADLKPVLEGMQQHLMKKNVAKEISEKVCEGVGESLVGKKVGGFETTTTAVRKALSTSITRILTPKTSTDLLLSIRTKLSSPLPSTQQRMPYSITFVGVNGVGKSTNLSKVCFWLIQNGLRVLIAACDTFRSGAVEQLRVHVRNLSMLGVNGAADSQGRVELYEKGYGKDAAGIAREAIAHARDNDFDVVLIDTAGRMQDNEPLMRALAKLVAVNNPDKILFVGEALVGNEAVDQLTKFDRALRDFSSASGVGKGRGIDGMLVTKWDTVDDKVGAALSMTYVTGQPIIFVGCGQTYTDLRQLRVANVVQAILSD
ncbi:signal recognition particle binding protein [Macrolepiota fuliginosa MF-IS2]|uniref:Signal recognition particle binding protein n=1 Tax=Macrolepiota fuliginosa MF-IS2 TaxID=1400762 RepID=A0A9P5XP68_9AGAR|nr:signal recognition particle binding protein [Macrolepiota fuliginosa MF-IS2]